MTAPADPVLIENTPDTVIAVVNGRKFTVGDLEKLLPSLPNNLQQLFAAKPQNALEQYAYGEVLAREAEKLKLEQREPYRQQIENARRQVLVQAVMKEKGEENPISAGNAQKFYEANPEDFRQAWVRIIFIGRAVMAQNLKDKSAAELPDASELKLKAEEAAKLAKEGKDFGELAKKYSDDATTAEKGGVLPTPIRANQQNIPSSFRQAVLKAAPGTIVGPIEHDTGWYVIRVDKVELPEFAAVRGDIEKQMKDAQLKRWMDEMKTKSSVEIQNPAFWETFKQANAGGASPSGVSK